MWSKNRALGLLGFFWKVLRGNRCLALVLWGLIPECLSFLLVKAWIYWLTVFPFNAAEEGFQPSLLELYIDNNESDNLQVVLVLGTTPPPRALLLSLGTFQENGYVLGIPKYIFIISIHSSSRRATQEYFVTWIFLWPINCTLYKCQKYF